MSEIIKLTKFNETFIKIDCSDGVAKELYDIFSFYVPNYQHMPRFKARVFDGKIRLFDARKRLIYKGLYGRILEFAKNSGYKVESGWKPYDNSLTREETIEIFKRVNGKFEPKDHQIDFLHNCLKYQNCLVLSPTSSGKSFAIYNLIRTIKKTGKGLLVVPSINLVGQMFKDFAEYSEKNGWVVSDNCHLIYEGQEKHSPKPIYISTWQSLQTLGPKYFAQFDYVIVDEAHGAKATELKRIMERCVNAKFRIGTTGTLDGMETNELVIQGLFGNIVQVISTSEMIKKGDASQLAINCMILNHTNKKENERILGLDYSNQLGYLVDCEPRNRFIRKIVAGEKGNRLVLFQYVEKHGIPLFKAFKAEYPDKEVYFISGDTPVKERERIRERLSQTDDAVLFASYGTYSTGMNVPSLKHVFSTLPGKSRVRVLQTIGRVLRLYEGKHLAMFWDFADEMRVGKRTNLSYKHFEERLEIYMKESFRVKQYRIDIK